MNFNAGESTERLQCFVMIKRECNIFSLASLFWGDAHGAAGGGRALEVPLGWPPEAPARARPPIGMPHFWQASLFWGHAHGGAGGERALELAENAVRGSKAGLKRS